MDKCIYHTTLHAHTRLWLSHNACMLQGESLRCKLRHKNTVESLKVILSRLLALKVSTLVPFIIIMIIMCPLNLSSQILEMSSQNSNCLDILSWHIKNLISTSAIVTLAYSYYAVPTIYPIPIPENNNSMYHCHGCCVVCHCVLKLACVCHTYLLACGVMVCTCWLVHVCVSWLSCVCHGCLVRYGVYLLACVCHGCLVCVMVCTCWLVCVSGCVLVVLCVCVMVYCVCQFLCICWLVCVILYLSAFVYLLVCVYLLAFVSWYVLVDLVVGCVMVFHGVTVLAV